MRPIYLRNQPPPIETFDHTSFISFLASWIRPESYLELGVRGGDNFRAISDISTRSTAVDMAPVGFEMPKNAKFFLGKTDEFFDQLDPEEKFDLIFIDADHSHEQSLRDFMNSQRFLVEDGFIIMHDTYPLNEEFTSAGWCGDCYKTPLYIKNNLSDSFETLTLPFHPGISIIKKMPIKKQLAWKDAYASFPPRNKHNKEDANQKAISMERRIETPRQISICFIGGSEERSRSQIEKLMPLSERYEIEFLLRSDVYSGMYSSFSQIVNELISESMHEFMIFVSEKVDPTPEQAEELIGYLCSGFCWASKVAFGFFASTKEMFRNIGLMDERFIGSEWEDIDLLCRMYMFGKAIKWEYDRSGYPPVPSRIGPLRGASLTTFRDKWTETEDSMIMDSEYSENKRMRTSTSRPDIRESWLDRDSSIFMDDNNRALTIFRKRIFSADFEKEYLYEDSYIDVEMDYSSVQIRFECAEHTEISMQILNSKNELATHGVLLNSNTHCRNAMFGNSDERMQIKIFHQGDKIYHSRNIHPYSETRLSLGLKIAKKTIK